MALAVELYFDAPTEETVDSLRDAVHAAGIDASPQLAGSRPHISLALVETEDIVQLSDVVAKFAAETESVPVSLVSLASFASIKGVLFLAPVPTTRLLEIHAHLYEGLTAKGLTSDQLYGPGSWVPHCTLEMGLSSSELATAFDSCWRNFSPVEGRLVSAGVVSYPPSRTHFETRLKMAEHLS